MDSRERIKTIIAGEKPDRCGLWLGNPHGDTWPIYLKHFGVMDGEDLRRMLGDDFRWICAEWDTYRYSDDKPMWNWLRTEPDGSRVPVFADVEDVQQIDDYDWPSVDNLDFTTCLQALRDAGNYYRASGFWCAYFHIVAEYFGMEEYFIKMHTNPDVVDAVTRHICEFYLEANNRFFELAGSEVDGFFMGNDYGTQLDLFISPTQWDRFIAPYTKKFIDQGHQFGHQVIHHSCGAIHKIIPRFIEMGLDALHPLQAKAADMDADTLARDFKGQIAFIGGIDTQDLLMNGTPEDIRRDVRRVKELLGPNLVVSPSHEALLPNVPPENVKAMADAARE